MSTKLYPPQIAGALPAFCKTYDILKDLSIGAKITIPFIMNAGVGEAEVRGFALRLKTASSNTYICPVLYSTNWDREKSTVTFELGEEYANLLNEGQFYKVQLAYYTYKTELVLNPTTGLYEETIMDITNYDNFIIGYYSTVGIIKCISKPKISIEGYTADSINLFNGTFLGVYDQTESPDKTEKVYSYRFDFYDIDDNLVQTSGELIHNINNDSDFNYSTDRYICNDFIQPTEVYRLVYTVTTMNGYVGSSPRYKVTANARLAPGRYMEVVTIPDIEDGCIDVTLKGELGLSPEGKMDEALYYGEYVLLRASEEDNYVEWERIQEFRLSNQKPSTFHFYDFSVKQGVKYIYAIQQFNMSKLHSTKILSPKVSVDFEDMFLFDGERSLRIRFNPKMSSFKTTHLEKKVETIGSKYPFVFRNGAVGYKEFPVEGLISYNMDENQRFFTREELYNFYRQNEETRNEALNAKYIEYHRRTDLTEDNILLERNFKIAVLDWLNNGEPKLFKSATEGNFIVRLINISLNPEDTLGRMLHSFKATAIEIAECTLANLNKYGFTVGGAIGSFVPLWRTYDFNKMDNSLDGRGKELKFDQEVTSFKIEGVLPRTKVYIYYADSAIPEEVIIGATGAYAFSGSTRRVTKLLFVFENNLNIQGHIECEYMGRRYSNFDAITDIKLQTIISNQVIGTNPQLEYLKRSKPSIANFELAVNGLIDTNYRTLLSKYLLTNYINDVVNGIKPSVPAGGETEWRNLLADLDLMETPQDQSLKAETSFDPSDTIQYIKTDFYDYERNKLSILNMEQAILRQRELIPVYVVPYEMVTPEAWRKMPEKVYRSKTDRSDAALSCVKEHYYDGNNNLQYKDYYSKANYEKIDFPTWELMFSTTPFGQPYPIDELITYLTLQIQNYEPMIDKHFVYIIYKYNRKEDKWYPIDNYSDVAPGVFSGSYYDPYRKELMTKYETTFYINDRYRYDPIAQHDIIKQNGKNIWRVTDEPLINTNLYIKDGKEYKLATKVFTYPDIFTFWIDVKEPEYYYMRTENNIDLQYAKEMKFEQLGEVEKFGISNGIISEQTFQLQIMDYYTEVNDLATAQAKQKYLDASQFLKDVFRMFDNIEQADVKQYKYNTLYEIYNLLLAGCATGDHPMNAYDFLIMLILLEEEFVHTDLIQNYFLPRLDGPTAPNSADIKNNLKRLISQYKGTKGVPMLTLIEDMFYTENEVYLQAYNNRKNIFIILFNQINKYSELKLIETEKEDLMSLFTDGKVTGLDSKNQSLKRLYTAIETEIKAKEQKMEDLKKELGGAQKAVLTGYENYNRPIGYTSAVEWIKRLRELNPDGDLLDFLTTVESVYSVIANEINVESQYQQEQIDKWRAFYRNNYDTLNSLVTDNATLIKIRGDNEGDDDLDDYLNKAIDKNLQKMVLLASQMEIIEKTKYNNEIPIITEEDKKIYINKKIILDEGKTFNYLYKDFLLPTLNSLNNDIQSGLKSIPEGETIPEDNTRLIETIKEFVLQADIYELYKGFTNWSGSLVFNFNGEPNWIKLRDEEYIKRLPPIEIASLERNILKINNSGSVLDDTLKTNKEESKYLFSKDSNIKEYKNRVSALLECVRAIIKNVNVSATLQGIIDATATVSQYQMKYLSKYIAGSPIESLKNAIRNANGLIVKYIDLLHNSDRITPEKWNELLDDFNKIYPFDSYIAAEPQEYVDKINKAKLITTSPYDIEYKMEEGPDVNENVYSIDGKEIIPASGAVTDYTFILTYKYFSDFYWKFIGEEVDQILTNGMLFWYIDVVLQGEIEYQKKVLADMRVLLDEYNKKIANYNEKRNRYEKEYEGAKEIFEQYRIEYPEVFNYYFSNSGDQYELIDRAIANAKKYWNLFIIELDLGYRREIERGMYG